MSTFNSEREIMYPVKTLSKKVDDIDIYVEIFASGLLKDKFSDVFSDDSFLVPENNVLILLHGNGEDGRIFSENIDVLCAENYVITIDSRGHGKSSRGAQELTIELMAEDLATLCNSMNIGKFKLLGFSDGGNIALTYALRHPERLSHLIVAGANLNPKGIKGNYKAVMLVQYFFAKIFCSKNPDKKIKFELLNLMVNHPHITPRLLNNILCPSLVLDAQYDVIRPLHTNLIAKSIPNSKRIVIKKSHHNIFKDKTDEVNSLISSFIEGEL